MPETVSPNPSPAPAEPTTPEVDPRDHAALETFNKTQTPQEAPERPAWLPEKFQSPEDLAKSYAELEAKLNSKPTGLPKPPEGAEGIPPTTTPLSDEEVSRFTAEFAEKGTLSEESFAEIEALGVPRGIAQAYVQGLQAMQERQLAEIHSIAGGAEQFEEVMEWATSNLSEAEKNAYNDILATNDTNKIKLAFYSLNSRFSAANPKPANLIQSDGGTPIAEAFANQGEMVAAMSDRRYKNDPAYRKQVDLKVARSKF
jgi:hypothetical protein